jgi:23S rRNA (guanine745-N1)-methyltransferase
MNGCGISLICENRHQFDLSKKGTLYFLKKAVDTGYTKKMLAPRGRIIACGMYDKMLEKLAEFLPKNANVLDAGAGEGGFLAKLACLQNLGIKFGIDISKDAIQLATNHALEETLWCVADLTRLPFETGAFDCILNIFSPSHYGELQRAVKEDGVLIKVIPEEHYLEELRLAFYPDDEQKQHYSNAEVLAKFQQEMNVAAMERVSYTFDLPKENQLDLLEMSPLEWGVTEEVKRELQKHPLEKITVDVLILVGEKREIVG